MMIRLLCDNLVLETPLTLCLRTHELIVVFIEGGTSRNVLL